MKYIDGWRAILLELQFLFDMTGIQTETQVGLFLVDRTMVLLIIARHNKEFCAKKKSFFFF